MRFEVGDTIKVQGCGWFIGHRLVGQEGQILEIRHYPYSRVCNFPPTHYVIKFPCYKIAHVYTKNDIDDNCILVSHATDMDGEILKNIEVKVRPDVRVREKYH